MKIRTLVRRSLAFHWRAHLGVGLGAAIGTATLLGALVLGDSVRGTLRTRALERLGATALALRAPERFFTDTFPANEADRLPGAAGHATVLQLLGAAARPDGAARAHRVQLLGVTPAFWRMAATARTRTQSGHASVDRDERLRRIGPNEAFVNRALATRLALEPGDELVLRVPRPTALSADVALSPRSGNTAALRVRVAAILDGAELGNFSLQNHPLAPLNVFVAREDLQRASGLEGRANLLLVSAPEPAHAASRLLEQIQAEIQTRWTLADLEAHWRIAPDGRPELRSSRVFLDPPIERATREVAPGAQGLLTYLANLLCAGSNATPYSMVTAAGPPWTPADMRDDEILVNQWLAEDLRVKPSDAIALVYFDPESGGRLVERTNRFRVRGIVPMELPWADRTLMPDFPGIEKAESTRDWDAGFPLTYTIRTKDEAYWRQYRGTPKAFITLAAGQTMWANRFGNLTAIRFPGPERTAEPNRAQSRQTGTSPTSADSFAPALRANTAALEAKILARLRPDEFGLRFEPVRQQALRSAEQAQDFGGLFLGLSLFLIAAALLLMALLFQFGLEQRSAELGTLLALGFEPKQVRALLLGEGAALAWLGGLFGVLGGLGYARIMLHGLNTVWRGAVAGAKLDFHLTAQSLAFGLLAGAAVAVLTIRLGLRRWMRLPVRALLSGETTGEEASETPGAETPGSRKSRGRRGAWRAVALIAFVLGAGTAGWALATGEMANVSAFFSAGALLLVAGISFTNAALAESTPVAPSNPDGGPAHGGEQPALSLARLGVGGCRRRRSRSVATVGMLACGVFLIVSVAVFRLDANRNPWEKTSGTGGFALVGETALPVVHDLNAQSGRDFFALPERELEGVRFVPLRVQEGDEASCLNLNRAQRPRLLGVRPELLEGRFTCAQGAGWEGLRGGIEGDQWEKSDRSDQHAVPAIGDANSIRWAMGKKVGDTLDYVDERGRPFKVRLVGAVAISILQGQLIIDEAEFLKRFPGQSGYRMFLIDAPSNRVAAVSAVLSRALEDAGLELEPAAERLARFYAVQNTYLSTFQVLGGLGLLLGSAGLGIVVLRNALERRGELALLLAVGFRRREIEQLLLFENGALLTLGLLLGMGTAAIAVLPAAAASASPLPWNTLALTLAGVWANGLAWTWSATRLALRGNLLDALRNE